MQPYSKSDTQAIESLFSEFLHGWNTGDAVAFGAVFSDTVDFIAFDGTHLTDKNDVINVHQDLFDTWLRGSRLTGTPDIRPLSPDIALVIASGGTIMRGKSTPAPERESIQTLTAIRTPDGWRFTSFQNTRVRPIGQNRRSALVWLFTDKLWKLIGGSATPKRPTPSK